MQKPETNSKNKQPEIQKSWIEVFESAQSSLLTSNKELPCTKKPIMKAKTKDIKDSLNYFIQPLTCTNSPQLFKQLQDLKNSKISEYFDYLEGSKKSKLASSIYSEPDLPVISLNKFVDTPALSLCTCVEAGNSLLAQLIKYIHIAYDSVLASFNYMIVD